MHELGIVFYIIRDVKKVAEENHVERVSSVVMDMTAGAGPPTKRSC